VSHPSGINHWLGCPMCYVGLLKAEALGAEWATEALHEIRRRLNEREELKRKARP
jgi:hypothetical protein